MAGRLPVVRVGLLLSVVCLAAAGTILAGASGVVVDSRFLPRPGAEACLVEENRTGSCILTDGGGEYVLPDSEMTGVRISLQDYIPVVVPAVDHVKPVMLERAAALLLFAVNGSTGEFLPEGEFWISAAGGGRTGPFPVSAGGTRVKSLRPGRIAVRVEIPGFLQEDSVWVGLDAGNETRVEVRVVPVSPAR